MPRYLIVALLLVATTVAWGSSKRKPLILTVHVETDASEGSNFSFPMPLPGTGQQRYFKKSADITDREVEWFYLFPAENGNGQGVAFKFNSVGTNRLEYISTSNQGRHLLIVVHPGVSSFVHVDKVISDGVVVVWEGVGPAQIEALREYCQERTPAPGTEAATGDTPSEPKKGFKLFRK